MDVNLVYDNRLMSSSQRQCGWYRYQRIIASDEAAVVLINNHLLLGWFLIP